MTGLVVADLLEEQIGVRISPLFRRATASQYWCYGVRRCTGRRADHRRRGDHQRRLLDVAAVRYELDQLQTLAMPLGEVACGCHARTASLALGRQEGA